MRSRQCALLLIVCCCLAMLSCCAASSDESGSSASGEGGGWMWWLLGAVLWMIKAWLFVLLLVLSVVWWNQGMLLYMPFINDRNGTKRLTKYNEEGFTSVSAWNKLMPSQEHYVPTVDGERVHLWLMLQPQAMTGQQAQDSKQREQSPVSPAASSSSSYSGNGVPTILFFHGNAGNIGYRLPTATDLYKHVQCNVVLVEYRGFGNSSGRPSQVGFTQDAQSVLQWALAHPNIDSSCIFVYGRSLGGAVSVALCQKSQQFVRGLVLENTFTSITDMAHELAKKIDNKWLNKFIPLIPKFLYVFLLNKWDSETAIRDVNIPVLFFSGLQDELIPPQQMQRMFNACSGSVQKTMHTVPTGTHNDTNVRGGMAYMQAWQMFVKETMNRT